jgi:isoleucyl-tRNA synthetase
LWNIHQYLLDYLRSYNINPEEVPEDLELEEKYILSRLNKTIRDVTELYEFYKIDKVPVELENFILSLSREYIQITRDKVHEKPQLVLSTIYYSLLETLKMFSTVCPFISEKIYQNFKLPFNLEEESITMTKWPEYNSRYMDEDLEKQFSILQDMIQAGLAAREKAKKGVRWPLAKVEVISSNEDVKETIKNFKEILKSKLNVKDVEIKETFKFESVNVVPNIGAIGRDFKRNSGTIMKSLTKDHLNEFYEKKEVKVGEFTLTKDHLRVEEKMPDNVAFSDFRQGKIILDTIITDELEQEGFARELIRRIQDLRKEKGLKKKDSINLSVVSDYDLKKWEGYIKEKVGASILEFTDKAYENSQQFEIKSKKFKISFIKI